MVEEWKRRRERGKEGNKKKEKKEYSPPASRATTLPQNVFSRGLIKKGWRGEEGEETARAILSEREISSGL